MKDVEVREIVVDVDRGVSVTFAVFRDGRLQVFEIAGARQVGGRAWPWRRRLYDNPGTVGDAVRSIGRALAKYYPETVIAPRLERELRLLAEDALYEVPS